MAAPQKHPADDIAASLARINGMLTMLSGVYDPQSGTFVTGIPFVHETVQAMEILVARATEALTVMYQTCDLTVVRDIPPKKAPAPSEEDIKSAAPPPSKLSQATQAFNDAARFVAVAKAYAQGPQEALAAMNYVPVHPQEIPQSALQARVERQKTVQPTADVAPRPAPAPVVPKVESYMNAFGPAEQPSGLSQRVEKSLSAGFVPPLPAAPPAPVESAIEKRAESYEELLQKITNLSTQAASDGNNEAMDKALLPIVEGIRADLAKMRSVA